MTNSTKETEMILKIDGLNKYFGAFQAIKDVSIQIAPQIVCALIGPNGAGKSTLFNLVTGKLVPDSGKIVYHGKDITGTAPHAISKLGIGRSFQVSNIFPTLSVYENIRIGVLSSSKKALRFFFPVNRFQNVRKETEKILSEIGLEDKAYMAANALSQGDLKCLEMGLALACKPKVLLLDEPTAGMNPEESKATVYLIKRIALDRDLTIVFTEHDMDIVFSISEYIYVLHYGSIIAQGTPENIKSNQSVRKAYLGEET